MARGLAALVLAGLLAFASGCGSGVQKASIRIVRSRVVGQDVILTVKINGWKMAAPVQGRTPKPRTGQWQIFAGDRYVGWSDQPTYGILTDMPVGTFKVWVALARTDYSLVYPLIRSQLVTVRVGGGKLYNTATE
jgi:hypothetical protein